MHEFMVDTPNGPHMVRSVGSGSPMMVVPGGPGWGADYMIDSLSEALAGAHRLVFVDQRGTGASPVGIGPLTADAFIQDMAAIADRLGIDELDVLGHSFGGLQVLMFAIAYPDRVGQIVIADGDPPTRGLWERASASGSPFDQRTRPEDIAEMAAVTADPDWMADQALLDRYLVAAYRPLYASPTVATTIRHGMDGKRFTQLQLTTQAVRDELGAWDITAQLTNVSAPVLLVYCRESIHGTATAESLRGALPNSKLIWVEGGHAPFIEDPSAFTSAVNAFLGDQQGQSQTRQ
ncbi:MAG: alpha/beta hydrolase [Actinomycetota bacterium]|nr:alpha/beta hydrolase [Actinomycetota bacterium]